MRTRLVTFLALLLVSVGLWFLAGGLPPIAVHPTPTVTSSEFATSRPPTTAFPATGASPPGARPIPDGYRVQVPRLRIDLPIKEGDFARDIDNQQTPEHAAFHLPGTRIPGEGSNSYIYAHARTGMFLSLWDARVGDDVIVAAPDGTQLGYVVSEVHPRIPYTEVKWAEPTPSERLTLQTSTGPNPQDPRFVVVAVPKRTRAAGGCPELCSLRVQEARRLPVRRAGGRASVRNLHPARARALRSPAAIATRPEGAMTRSKGAMTVAEAGRKGGATTAQRHGPEFYEQIGKKGGRTTAERHGSDFYEQIGKRGGQKVKELYGPRFYGKIGKIGGDAVSEKYGHEHFEEIGKKGGQKVAELIARGRQAS